MSVSVCICIYRKSPLMASCEVDFVIMNPLWIKARTAQQLLVKVSSADLKKSFLGILGPDTRPWMAEQASHLS